MPERTFDERVDDTILVGSLRLAEFRKVPIREMVKGHAEQCRLNATDTPREDPMHDYWLHRIKRCNVLLLDAKETLRHAAWQALNREVR